MKHSNLIKQLLATSEVSSRSPQQRTHVQQQQLRLELRETLATASHARDKHALPQRVAWSRGLSLLALDDGAQSCDAGQLQVFARGLVGGGREDAGENALHERLRGLRGGGGVQRGGEGLHEGLRGV